MEDESRLINSDPATSLILRLDMSFKVEVISLVNLKDSGLFQIINADLILMSLILKLGPWSIRRR